MPDAVGEADSADMAAPCVPHIPAHADAFHPPTSTSPTSHSTNAMNRLANQDDLVFSIKDLEREGTKKLSKTVAEYYNEGSMDLLT